MKHDKFQKFRIGASDIARLIAVGYDPDAAGCVRTEAIPMGSDGIYRAYICPDNVHEVEIPDYYHLVAAFSGWARIYDDTEKTADFRADTISIYRAGDMGIIVKLHNADLEKTHIKF